MAQSKKRKKKKAKPFEYSVLVPRMPDWFKRSDDPRSISIHDLPKSQLRQIGRAFSNNLMEFRKYGISGKFIESV